ncbi:YicC/YloC family endoribonuclease [Ammoniphilus sp. CFH 90114]|uniref:YicC/YloC family endoribonuclease n=1 Tax=Ammoniphilus sp. CFH 90114 TaxID=2493665 RepID=UPI00100F59C8|nr:YicC/YloC family endoribonuclease [Ammoniphilus sp. CFH 90114]RXT15040.1 YicC family protein [Ammoniphilus sp. CFH 90114]
MIMSMTGYGQAFTQTNDFQITVEMKTVNHRFLEYAIRMPREFSSLEELIKKKAASYLRRGKADIFISIERSAPVEQKLAINWQLAEEYYNTYQLLRERFSIEGESLRPMDLLALPDLVSKDEPKEDIEKYAQVILDCVELACQQLIHMRKSEGKNLEEDLTNRVRLVSEITEDIRLRAPLVVAHYQTRLTNRIKEFLSGKFEGDEGRILTEVAIFSEKANIDEELTRLASHCQQFFVIMQSQEPVGRKLDFLVQEMNREANTIGSKANDLEISKRVVDLKAELEKIKEQVQNIE